MEEVVISTFAGRITLTEAEQKGVIHLKSHEFESLKTKLNLSLVGKVLTTEPFSRIAFKTKMVMAWNPTKAMKIRVIDDNLFLFVFGNMEDKQRVLDNGPWCFENALLVLDHTDGSVSPSEMKLNHAELWVRVHNLPLLGMNGALGRKIANFLGKCIEVEEEGEDGECWGKYMRLKVRMDVTKKLRRGMKICVEGCEPFWVDFKYEGVPEFCYHCGTWGHNEKECEVAKGKERGFLFGAFSRMYEYVSSLVGLWYKDDEPICYYGVEGDSEKPEVVDEDQKECSSKLSHVEGMESNGDQGDLTKVTEGLESNGDDQGDLTKVGFQSGSVGEHESSADHCTKAGMFQFGSPTPEHPKHTRVIRKGRHIKKKINSPCMGW